MPYRWPPPHSRQAGWGVAACRAKSRKKGEGGMARSYLLYSVTLIIHHQDVNLKEFALNDCFTSLSELK